MNVLVIYAHPSRDSFNAAILDVVRRVFSGADLRIRDINAEGFDPVLTLDRYNCYNDPDLNAKAVEDYARDLQWAEALMFIYPTWWYGQPAILKGWLERVMSPGVAVNLDDDGKPAGPKLNHIKVLGAIVTYGAPWWWTRFIGDPGRRILMRGVRWLCMPRCRTFWIAHYNMHKKSRRQIEGGLHDTERKLRKVFRGKF
ncbi:MAG: NAD(P)H dehydrogenase [Thiotrichales bacterium]|nr:NAD(P)H dehydrogenase [Thiotrichales bacterium]